MARQRERSKCAWLPVVLTLAAAGLWLAACGGRAATSTPPAGTSPANLAVAPTATAAATRTPEPTATPSPTPTPTPTHPLMIAVMRGRDYPGSELVIESTLAPEEGYALYLASYLSEGNKIIGLLAVPNGPQPASGWPVILLNHGRERPETYDVTLRYRDHVDALARNGYIIFHPAYRGHGNSEGRAPGDPFASPAYTTDALNALAAIKTYPGADPRRIGLWGHSMGGFITLRAMVVSDEIDAGVIWAGVVGGYPDLFAREAATATAVAVASPVATVTPSPGTPPAPPARETVLFPRLRATYGSPEENPAFWQSISATAYLADLSGPLQLHHALTDAGVPATASILLHAQLEAAGQPSELFLYENDTHNLGRNFDLAMERTVAFFDRFVKGSDE